jgi:hypothetical protein
MHVPLTEKQPEVRLMPSPKVEVAEVPVRLRYVAERPPEKVEVEFVPNTLRKPWILEVPTVLACNVVVAEPPIQSEPKTDSLLDEAPALKF